MASQEVSEIAANRVIKKRIQGPRNLIEPYRHENKKTWQENLDPIEKELVPVYNRNISINTAYKNFVTSNFQFDKTISLSTFINYIPKQFEKPYRFTDMCEYCEYGRIL